MILDFLTLNITGILLSSVLLNIFYLNKKRIFIILGIDIILNGIPFVTIILILLSYLNNFIFKYFNFNFINMYICLIIYYFLFNIILYSIFNPFNTYILKLVINNLIYNLIIFYIGLKYLSLKYSYNGG